MQSTRELLLPPLFLTSRHQTTNNWSASTLFEEDRGEVCLVTTSAKLKPKQRRRRARPDHKEFESMMTMSRAISAGKALDYYKQEFTNSKDNYYTESGEVKGRWYGSLAEEWNLKGEVTSEQYERLVAGQDPHTGEQLIRSVSAREIVDDFGKEKTTSEHRAGWDATFSAPKSVSLAALVGDDERVREAHRESVNEALKELEKYLQARGGGDKPAITTGKMIAAQFEHTSSRPDHANGYAAPQLHTHVLIFNMTQCEDGKVRSVQPLELYRSQQYATAIYRANLADNCKHLVTKFELIHAPA